MRAFVALNSVFSIPSQRLPWGNVSDMTYFVSSGTVKPQLNQTIDHTCAGLFPGRVCSEKVTLARAVFKGVYGFNPPPRNVKKKIFWHCKKHARRNVSANALCLHYCDARKSHLASIKCKTLLGQPRHRPGPRWGSLQRSPRPPS